MDAEEIVMRILFGGIIGLVIANAFPTFQPIIHVVLWPLMVIYGGAIAVWMGLLFIK